MSGQDLEGYILLMKRAIVHGTPFAFWKGASA